MPILNREEFQALRDLIEKTYEAGSLARVLLADSIAMREAQDEERKKRTLDMLKSSYGLSDEESLRLWDHQMRGGKIVYEDGPCFACKGEIGITVCSMREPKCRRCYDSRTLSYPKIVE